LSCSKNNFSYVPDSRRAGGVNTGLVAEPLAVTKRDASVLVRSPKLVQRWLFYGWLLVVRRGGPGRQTLIDYKSLVAAYERYARGDEPPLLPSEQRSSGAAENAKLKTDGSRA
jgi:hypothetical protein